MTGARIEIEVDDAAVQDVLRQATASLSTAGMQGLLADIGEYLRQSTYDRSLKEVSPGGAPWQPLSKTYAVFKLRKVGSKKMLHFDEHMLGDQLSAQVDGDTLRVGTNAVYGAIHQFGGTIKHAAYGRVRDKAIIGAHEQTMPARPWLGISAEDETEIAQLTLDHIHAALDGAE